MPEYKANMSEAILKDEDEAKSVSSEGYIIINIFCDKKRKPQRDVNIKLFKENEEIAFIELQTNLSGQTEKICIPCPPRAYSLQPDSPRPYAKYNIKAEKNGYKCVRINGIQIFDGATAIQDIFLPTEGSQEHVIEIKDHVLHEKYPYKLSEDIFKDIDGQTGFAVIDNPYVPEKISVHDGQPDDCDAKNYIIGFKDYIKNTAACELYPTWPEAALKAGIYAIISFTLNRIQTQWYRKMGKNFTITSSTAHDQPFSPYRNTYNEISRIVDDVFLEYITKPTFNQPFLAQRCDGVRLTRPDWLSLWAAKKLAEQNYNHLDILKMHYGNDIHLKKAECLKSCICHSGLAIGSRGNEVRKLQECLNIISLYYPEIKKLKVDGIYGDMTKKSVEKFQNINILPVTGIVDHKTWNRLWDMYSDIIHNIDLV